MLAFIPGAVDLFNNQLIRSLASSSDEHSLRLSERDWELVLNANRNFQEAPEHWKGNSIWGRLLSERVGGERNLKDFNHSLELCCGTGFLYFSFKDRFDLSRNCDFIDISQTQTASFEARCRALGITAPPIITGDIGNLPFDDSSKQLVYGHSFLHHLPDVGKYLREIFRVLAPGGRFVAFHEPTRTAPFLESFPRSLVKTIERGSLTDIWLIQQEVIKEILGTQGFKKIEFYPTGLFASIFLVPLQIALFKITGVYQTDKLLKLKILADQMDRILPKRFRARFSPSLAMIAHKI